MIISFLYTENGNSQIPFDLKKQNHTSSKLIMKTSVVWEFIPKHFF